VTVKGEGFGVFALARKLLVKCRLNTADSLAL
jgi:hypothetical protein